MELHSHLGLPDHLMQLDTPTENGDVKIRFYKAGGSTPFPAPSSGLLSVVILPPNRKIPLSSQPFATVAAIPPGESSTSKARIGLHFIRDKDGGDSFADGVLASKDASIVIRGWRPWPEMWKALSLEPQALKPLTKATRGEPPYMRVKNLVEDGATRYQPSEDSLAHGARALIALSKWNSWIKDDVKSSTRLEAFYPKEVLLNSSLPTLEAKADALRKFWKSIGLQEGQHINFDEDYRHLKVCLNVAYAHFAEVHST